MLKIVPFGAKAHQVFGRILPSNVDKVVLICIGFKNSLLCHIKEKWKRPLKDTSLLLALNIRHNIALMSEC